MSNHNMGGKNRRRRKNSLHTTYGGTCIYCRGQFPQSQLTIEHLIPRSRGGSNALHNLRLACFPCNNQRGARPMR
ncbi:HNH endonuclease [Leptolyngbya iicbica]|uniref:HNH endonuclease n=2 Tax=Cyanophyceae TaxID=3028117 RepID=A0A4Q7EE61_9CYAN|nr:HNH endonuclease [Leptolyngbya sp. LK]RZM79535.1 HNH endonuclease [Leptolyngbya sp. LK]